MDEARKAAKRLDAIRNQPPAVPWRMFGKDWHEDRRVLARALSNAHGCILRFRDCWPEEPNPGMLAQLEADIEDCLEVVNNYHGPLTDALQGPGEEEGGAT